MGGGNDPEEQPNKPLKKDLTNEGMPGEKGGAGVCGVCVCVYVKDPRS